MVVVLQQWCFLCSGFEQCQVWWYIEGASLDYLHCCSIYIRLGMKKKAQNTGGVCFARVGWGCENEWNEFARNCMQYSFETSCNLTWAAFNVMYYGFLCHWLGVTALSASNNGWEVGMDHDNNQVSGRTAEFWTNTLLVVRYAKSRDRFPVPMVIWPCGALHYGSGQLSCEPMHCWFWGVTSGGGRTPGAHGNCAYAVE